MKKFVILIILLTLSTTLAAVDKPATTKPGSNPGRSDSPDNTPSKPGHSTTKPIRVQSDTSLALMLGEPLGIRLKLKNLPVLGLAWSLNDYLYLHADFWLINNHIREDYYWYLGVGGKLGLFGQAGKANETEEPSGFSLGVRVPVGAQWFIQPRMELFCEVAPGFSLITTQQFDLDAGVGIRYHF